MLTANLTALKSNNMQTESLWINFCKKKKNFLNTLNSENACARSSSMNIPTLVNHAKTGLWSKEKKWKAVFSLFGMPKVCRNESKRGSYIMLNLCMNLAIFNAYWDSLRIFFFGFVSVLTVRNSYLFNTFTLYSNIGVGKGGGLSPPPNNLKGGANIPFAPPPNNPSTFKFLQFLCEKGKNHKCTKMKRWRVK